MYNLTKCALCGNEAELELSHTVPKMAVRTLKKTAIGKVLGFTPMVLLIGGYLVAPLMIVSIMQMMNYFTKMSF